jgi:hypothetical protein
MSYVNVNVSHTEVEVEVDEFLEACDEFQIEEITEYLVEEGHINKFAVNDYYTDQSVTEIEFEDALKKLQGNWNRLSSDDEAIILKIANQF